jgi:molybdopterin synthase sulfur carrier subunit
MPTVHLPAALKDYAAGQRRLEVAGVTVGGLLAALRQAHPGVGQRVLDERGLLRPHVNVFVNGESVRYLSGLETPLGERDEVWILPAVSGGSPGDSAAAAAYR